MAIKDTIKKVTGKGKGAAKKKITKQIEADSGNVAQLNKEGVTFAPSAPAAEVPVPEKKSSTKTIQTADGTEVPARSGFRAMFNMGNVGWQEMLANLRLLLNVAFYLIKIGAPDDLVTRWIDKARLENARVEGLRVKIPSDMVTQLHELESRSEAIVGSNDYIKAIRKLSELSKRVAEDRSAILSEVVSAKKMITQQNS